MCAHFHLQCYLLAGGGALTLTYTPLEDMKVRWRCDRWSCVACHTLLADTLCECMPRDASLLRAVDAGESRRHGRE